MAGRLIKHLMLLSAIFLLTAPPATAFTTVSGGIPRAEISILADADYFPALINQVRKAAVSIDLSMFIFKTSEKKNSLPAMLIQELGAARRRGVKIRAFLERSGHDEKINTTNQQTARLLSENGIEVIFDSPKTTNHSKIVVIDRRFCLVGSHNFTQAALKHNHELSLLIENRELARKLTTYMEGFAR